MEILVKMIIISCLIISCSIFSYLIFCGTTKSPQNGVKRENPFFVQKLPIASQKIQKYSYTNIQKYENMETMKYRKSSPLTLSTAS